MAKERFWVSGVVLEQESGRALSDLVVRAYDKDLVFDDVLGFATTDADGAFRITFSSDEFQDWFEKRPDLYLRVFDREGVRELHSTRKQLRKNAEQQERFELQIPAARLQP
jgi:hypothetical protein